MKIDAKAVIKNVLPYLIVFGAATVGNILSVIPNPILQGAGNFLLLHLDMLKNMSPQEIITLLMTIVGAHALPSPVTKAPSEVGMQLTSTAPSKKK